MSFTVFFLFSTPTVNLDRGYQWVRKHKDPGVDRETRSGTQEDESYLVKCLGIGAFSREILALPSSVFVLVFRKTTRFGENLRFLYPKIECNLVSIMCLI